MSASAIMDGIVNNLSATSALGACAVGFDYSVMETTSTCCAVLSWSAVEDEQVNATFSGNINRDGLWTFTLQGFIKDTGNACALMKQTITFADTVLASLRSDLSVQGTADSIQAIRGSKTPGVLFTPPQMGTTWLPMDFEIDVVEYI